MHTPTNPTGRSLDERLSDYSAGLRASAPGYVPHARKLADALASIEEEMASLGTRASRLETLRKRRVRALVFLAAPLN